MKKLYLITILSLIYRSGFAGNGLLRLSDDTLVVLIILAGMLVIVLAYLFLQSYLEYFFRNKEIEKDYEEDDEEEELDALITGNKMSSDELLNLFMLKRKGVISEREYHQLKDRLIKRKT